MNDMPRQRILITQAQPGMVLAERVTDNQHVALCGAGTRLTEELVHRLLMRGILQVTVLGRHLCGRHGDSQAYRLQQLDERFRFLQGHEPF
ncbi:MAG: hypothetical protein ACOCXA_08355, partial [Planctomycetota bacterium]